MKFSDVIADDDLSTACDRKTPIFNIALADSNSNAKSNPDMKVLLTIFEFVFNDDVAVDDDDNGNNDLRLYFKR